MTPTPLTAADFGSVLKRFRRARGLSQEALAERAAISPKAIGALETGVRKSPYPSTVVLLADALRLDDADRATLEGAAATNRAARNAAADERSYDLPASLTPVVGRADDVRAILELLGNGRLVTIAGPGGIGKTTVALEVARAARPGFADGVSFCDLSALRDGELVGGAVAAARGLMIAQQRDATAGLVAAMKGSTALIVLDNCEHLVAHIVPLAEALLRGCPAVRIVATSRQRLGASPEIVYRIEPLATPAAVSLFVQRAVAANPRFSLADANAADVARICRRLDGIPLAIELAAAQMRVLTASDLERHLRSSLRLLSVASSNGRSQRTLHSAFAWSYGLLSAPEQGLFRALGIFADGFPFEAALDVCCPSGTDELEALGMLMALVDASLVVADTAGEVARYRLLETTRAYAAEEMSAHGEFSSLAARHLRYYSAHGRELDMALDLEDIRAALRFALDGGEHLAGARLLVEVGARWSLVGLAPEAVARLEEFLPLIPATDTVTAARARVILALLYGEMLHHGSALEEIRRATELARVSGDDHLAFEAARSLAYFAALRGELSESDAALREAGHLADRTPSPRRLILLRYTEGTVALRRGDGERAETAFGEAYERSRALGDAYLQVYAGGSYAEALHANGNTSAAADLVTGFRTDPALRHIQDAASLANLVGYRVSLGDDAAAFAVAGDLLAMRSSHPIFRAYETLAVEHVALVHAHRGDHARAARLAGYCDAWYQNAGYERQHTEMRSHEALMECLDAALSSEQLTRLFAEGAMLSAEAAGREALQQ